MLVPFPTVDVISMESVFFFIFGPLLRKISETIKLLSLNNSDFYLNIENSDNLVNHYII